MGVLGWLDGRQRRHRWLGLPLAVVYKMIDVDRDQAEAAARQAGQDLR